MLAHLRIIVHEKPLIRLLQTIGNNSYFTRELLIKQKEYGYGHKLLKRAYELQLVERKRVKPQKGMKGNWRIYNNLTPAGKNLVQLTQELGI